MDVLHDLKNVAATYHLKQQTQKCQTLTEHIDFCLNYNIERSPFKWRIAPMQKKTEIQALLTLLSERKIETALEVGTAAGGTLYLLSRVAESDATLVSLDLPGGCFGGGYPVYREKLYRSFAREKQRIHLLRLDSHNKESLLEVQKVLAGRKLDFLFIDGDHTFEGVKTDFEMYSPLVKVGGLIVFHDIQESYGPKDLVDSGGVPLFWREVKQRFRFKEFIEGGNGFGIGVLFKD